MPGLLAPARARPALAMVATALALATGSAGPALAGPVDDPVATTPDSAATPAPTPAPEAPEPEPPAPAAEAAPEPGPVIASAVVLPAPTGSVPTSERIATGTDGPSVRIVSSGKHLLAARMRSLNLKVDVAGAVSLKAWVILPRSAVKASRVDAPRRDLTLARLSTKRLPGDRLTLKFPFGGQAQEALLAFYKVTVTVRLVATDAAGRVKTIEAPIALTD